MPSTLFFRGDCQPRRQVRKVLPASVEAGDVFTLAINRKDYSFTAVTGTVDEVCRGLYFLFGESADAAEFEEVTAALHYVDDTATPLVADYLLLYGAEDGAPFTVTSGTTEGGIGLTIEETAAGDPGTNEIQRITLPGAPTGGTFTLTYDGQTTGTIAYNADAATVEAAIVALSNVASGDVDVTGSAGGPWNVEFEQAFANVDVELITGDGTSLSYGAGAKPVIVTTLTQGVSGSNQVQRVAYAATSGTFTLDFDGEVTSTIAYNASAATVVTELEALSNIASGDVSVTKTVSGNQVTFEVTFKGAYRHTDAPLLTADGSSLDGGQSIAVARINSGAATTNALAIVTYTAGGTTPPRIVIVDPVTGISYTGTYYGAPGTGSVGFSPSLPYSPDDQVRIYQTGFGNPFGITLTLYQFLIEFRGSWAGKNFVTSPDTAASGEGSINNVANCTIEISREGDSTATNEKQLLTISGGATGGDFTITLSGQTTSAIAYNATAATVETELESLSTVNSVTVTGNAGGPWTVEFDGADAGTSKPLFTGTATGLTGAIITPSVRYPASAGTNETQVVSLGGSPAGGTFTISFEGDTTSAIAYNAAADTIRSELEGLSTLGSGTITVVGSDGGPWNVTFEGLRSGENVPAMTGSGASLTGGQVDVSTIQSATDAINEVQTVTVVQATGGTFTLTYSAQTTAAIAYNAAASTVQTALEQLSSITVGKVLVSGSAGGPYLVEFVDTLGATDLALMTGSAAGLTGTGSQTLVVSEITAPTGPNYWDDAENWSTGSLPITGDTVILENTDTDILYGLETLSAVTLAALHRRNSYTGRVGLKDFTGDYFEYRPRYLQIGVTALFIGEGEGSGGGRFRIDTQAVQTTIYIVDSGTPEVGSIPAIQHIGSNASNVLRLFKGSFGSAMGAGETSQFSAVQVGYRSDVKSDAEAYFGDGATLGTLDQTGGDVTVNSALGATTSTGGTLTINGTGAVSSLQLTGEAYCYFNTTGTLGGNTVVAGRATLDFSQDMRDKTVTNALELYGDERSVIDPFQVVASAVLDLNYSDELNGLELGSNIRLTRGTPS